MRVGTCSDGIWTAAQKFAQITDGLSNTVLFGEGYSDCDTVGRVALDSAFNDNFGIDWYGQPNTNMFQVLPGLGTCDTCCDNWRAQTAHPGGMSIALGDGSVRSVAGSISQTMWTRALLPRDGEEVDLD